MSWASSRRTLVLVIIGSVVAAIAALALIATFYETPSCADGKKNQDEQGIDCGGSCVKVCSVDASVPAVSFVRSVKGLHGRTDVVAYIENKNALVTAKNVPFTIELYGEDRTLIATKRGTTDLPPLSGVPLFLPDVYSGNAVVGDVFLQFDTDAIEWYQYTDTRVVPRVSDIQLGEIDTPRVRARLTNPSATPLTNVTVIATVFNAEGNAIAATQTVVPLIPAQGSVEAALTFAGSFIDAPARTDVRPIIPLP